MITRQVTPSESGKRLHRFLCQLMPNLPLGQIYKLIDQGKVRVNGKRKKQNYELGAGDELTLYLDEEMYNEASVGRADKKPKFVGIDTNIDVIYEDAELLVVNKPAGELTHPDRTEQKNTLIGRVHAYLHRKGELDSQLFLPAPANRLDRNTSGLVLIGKTAGMLHQLNQWIQKRDSGKFYLTIVEGQLTGDGEISGALVRSETGNRTRVAATPKQADEAKEAVTRYRTIQAGPAYSLVEVELISGRTHQIRAHFQSMNHPLVGDLKYGGKRLGSINHQLLHAWRIELPDGRQFRAPLPNQFRDVLGRIGLSLPNSDFKH